MESHRIIDLPAPILEQSEPPDIETPTKTMSDTKRTFSRSPGRTGHVKTNSMPENMISSSAKTPLQERVNSQDPVTLRSQAPVSLDDEKPIWETEAWKNAVSVGTLNKSRLGKKAPPKKTTAPKKKEKPPEITQGKTQTITRTSQVGQQSTILTAPQISSAAQFSTIPPASQAYCSSQASHLAPGLPVRNGSVEAPNYNHLPARTMHTGWSNAGGINFNSYEGHPSNACGAASYQYNTGPINYVYSQGYPPHRPSGLMHPVHTIQNSNLSQYTQNWNLPADLDYGPIPQYNSLQQNMQQAWAAAAPGYSGPSTTAPAVQPPGAPVSKPPTTIIINGAPSQPNKSPALETYSASPSPNNLSTRKFPQVFADHKALRQLIAQEHIDHHTRILGNNHPADDISITLRAAATHITTTQRTFDLAIAALEKKLEAAHREYAKLKQDYMHINDLFQELAQKNNKAFDERKIDKITIEKQTKEIKESKDLMQKLAEFNHHYLVQVDADILQKVSHPEDNNWDVPMNMMKMLKGIERYFTTPGMYIGSQAEVPRAIEVVDDGYYVQANPRNGIPGDALIQYHGQYSPDPAEKPVSRKRKASTLLNTVGKKTKTETAANLSAESATPATTTHTSITQAKGKAKGNPRSIFGNLSNQEDEADLRNFPHRSSSRVRTVSAALAAPTPDSELETTDEELKTLKLARHLAFGVGGRTRKKINYAEGGGM